MERIAFVGEWAVSGDEKIYLSLSLSDPSSRHWNWCVIKDVREIVLNGLSDRGNGYLFLIVGIGSSDVCLVGMNGGSRIVFVGVWAVSEDE
ncbi:hypothetical protein JTE90_008105 [Oedothorax gibbosus]|uniref:Uncharacterized protein n=1 Tax=Oedothorax gibbosus TaxID=931172 RepID=A0AAV6UZA9_9ARAC|nr:hypothetical protein JTE90_008105 [Oedothorax gibbosus]